MKGYKDILNIKRWLSALFCIAILSACSTVHEEDILPWGDRKAVEFSFAFPNDGRIDTRAKTIFDNGDLIYISGDVTLASEPNKIISTILKYEGGKWVSKDGTILSWPSNAVSATFKAYYIPSTINESGNTETPTLEMTNNFSKTIPLAHFKDATDDPFMAHVVNIPVNGVVSFQFAHMTTKFVVTGLKSKTEKVTFYNTDAACVIKNQIVFTYEPSTGFSHSFTSDGTNKFKQNQVTLNSTTYQSIFFLHVVKEDWQDYDDTFMIDQLDENNNIIDTPTPLIFGNNNKLSSMQRGRYYRVYFLSGQANTGLAEEEQWYQDKNKKEPFQTEQQIIDYFAELGGELTEDLDFNFIELSDGIIPFPRLSTKGIAPSQSLDGKNYTIRNIKIKNGLFDRIPSDCTIQNLRLENVQVESSGMESAGLLTPVNEGTIKNVRISGNNNLTTDGVSYVGGMAGINRGTIDSVKMEGTLLMDCYADESTMGSGPVGFGGLVGKNEAIIKTSEIISASLISVSGKPDREVCAGGFAGLNEIGKTISGSATNMIVDVTYVEAASYNVGGFVGKNLGTVEKSDATGDVKGGRFSEAPVRATIGGFVGYITSEGGTTAKVDGCFATGYVYEHTNNNTGSVYIGGFAGFSEIDLANCSSTGMITLRSGSSATKGALTGLISADKTITNSFSMTLANNAEIPFGGGEGQSKTANSHYLADMLDGDGQRTGVNATPEILNNARGTGLEWVRNTSYFGGAPFLVK